MSTRRAQVQLLQDAATSEARRSPGLPWLRFFALMVIALSVVVLTSFTAIRSAMASESTQGAALTAPTTSKELTDNGDGTYTLSLSVTGKSQSSSSSRGANVIVIMDTSGSMDYPTHPWSEVTRLDVAKMTTDDLIDSLLSNNTPTDPARVEVSLVTFSTKASTEVNWSTSARTLHSYIDNMFAEGGTNWEDALYTARMLAADKARQDGDPTYVIFVSDGLPTFYMGDVYGNSSSYWYTRSNKLNGRGNATTWREIAAAKSESDDIIRAGYGLYTVGAFGDVQNMKELGGTYYDASNSDALQGAFEEIAQEISNSIGYEGVSLTDGITSYTSTSLDGGGTGFSYTKTDMQGITVDWPDAPVATYENGTVTWDLSSVGQLKNGVTYTVSFKVWPSQEAYDLIAKLNNGTVSYDDLTADQQAQILQQGGTYTLKTNVVNSARVDYSYVQTKTDTLRPEGVRNFDGTITGDDGYAYTYETNGNKWVGKKKDTSSAGIVDPDPVSSTSCTIQLQKRWDNLVDDAAETSANISVIVDGDPARVVDSVALTEDSGWVAALNLSPGLMTVDQAGNIEVLDSGHVYTAQETDQNGLWDFTSDSAKPMIVNGTLLMLVEAADGPAGLAENTSAVKDGVTYYNLGGIIYRQSQDARLYTTNTRHSTLSITKSVTSDASLTPNADAAFGFEATIASPDGSDVTFWVADTSNSPVTSAQVKIDDADVTGNAGIYTAASGAKINVALTAGQSLNFDNLSTGSSYEVRELDTGAGFELSGLTATKANNAIADAPTGTVSMNDRKASGTIDSNNMRYAVAFTNTYSADMTVSVADAAHFAKVLNGRAWQDGDTFTFQMAPQDGAPSPMTPEVTLAGALAQEGQPVDIDFGTIEFAKTGVYTYMVSETSTAAQPGVTLSQATYKVVYTVSDNHDGTLSAVPVVMRITSDDGAQVNETVGAGAAAQFINSYSAAAATVNLSARKNYTNASGDAQFDLADGDFSVTLRPTGDNAAQAPMPTGSAGTGADRTYTASNVGTTFSIPEIAFTQYDKGTYAYTLSENGTSGNGLTYDDGVYTISVVVTDSADANAGTAAMVATTTVKNANGDEVGLADMTFTNVYDPADITLADDAALQVQKTLIGRDSRPGESFSFTLTKVGGPDDGVSGLDGNNQMSVSIADPIANGASASARFGAMTFSKAGTYTFSVGENVGNAGGVAYDAHASTITVVVSDLNADNNPDGSLHAYVSYDNAGALNDSDKNVENAAAFTNVYKATSTTMPSSGEGSLSVNKALVVPDGLTGPASIQGAFSFTLAPAQDYGDAIEMPQNTTVINPDANGGSVAFDPITFNKAGAYEFTITESGDVAGVTNDAQPTKTVSVNVVDDQNGHLVATVYGADNNQTSATTFTNTYAATSVDVSLTANKVLNNSFMRGGEFDFKLVGEGNAPMPEAPLPGAPMPESDRATNTADGVVEFAPIRFTAPGTYTYSISELPDLADENVFAYDTTARTVTVEVVDNQAGALQATVYDEAGNVVPVGTSSATFTNAYIATSDATIISAIKNVNGRAASSDETFQFSIEAQDGGALPAQTTVNNNGGSVVFGPITYSADIFANDTEDGVASSDADASQQAEKSQAADANQSANKDVTDSAATDETDVVVDALDDADAAADVAEAADDNPDAATDNSVASELDKTQANSSPSGNEGGNADADQAVDGALEQETAGESDVQVEVAAEQADAPAEVAGEPTDAPAGIAGEPTDAVDALSALFSAGEANASEPSNQQVGNSAPAIVHNPDGTRQITYTYVISEIVGNASGYGYASEQYAVHVTVTDDLAGNITTSVAYDTADGNAPTFENTYSAGGAATLIAHKVVTGPTTLHEGEFNFELRENGQTVATATNAADGTVTFDVQYSVNAADSSSLGTHEYSIVETGGNVNLANWTFDSAPRFATVTVDDNGDGTLSASVSYKEGVEPTFTNNYRPLPGNLTLTAHKVLTGRDLAAGEFAFQLLDENKSVISKASNDADGTVTFDQIGYVQAGSYTYYVAEVAGNDANVTYDKSVKHVTVEVSDKDGQLVASVLGDDDLTFTNASTQPSVPPKSDDSDNHESPVPTKSDGSDNHESPVPPKSDDSDNQQPNTSDKQKSNTPSKQQLKGTQPQNTDGQSQPTKAHDLPKTADTTNAGGALALGAAGAIVVLIGAGALLGRKALRRG